MKPTPHTRFLIGSPTVNIEAMNHHLAAISCYVSAGAIAVLVVDRAG